MVTKLQSKRPELEMFFIRLPIGLRNQIKSAAALKGLSMQDFVAEILIRETK